MMVVILRIFILLLLSLTRGPIAALRPFGTRITTTSTKATTTTITTTRHPWTILRGGSSNNEPEPYPAAKHNDSPSPLSPPWESSSTTDSDHGNFLGPVVKVPDTWATGTHKRGIILMDSFCPYFGGYLAHQARNVYGVCVIHVISNYMKGYFALNQQEDWKRWMPLTIPIDVEAWKESLPCTEIVAMYCESDSGLADAERFAMAVNVTKTNSLIGEARRDKYLMNQKVADAGIPIVRQRLCNTMNETLEFARELLAQAQQERDAGSHSHTTTFSDAGILGHGSNAHRYDLDIDIGRDNSPQEQEQQQQHERVYCIIKPTRGCASEHVHRCHDDESIHHACQDILSAGVFGSPTQTHTAVLVQEFAVGTEYAIDLVSKNGQHKVAALWRYDKRPANGAPFCYFATELVDATQSEIGAQVCRYAQSCLTALDYQWGISHVEVIVTAQGPRLVEVNTRQHNMDFAPIAMACIGYNAFDMLLAAYLGDEPDESYPPQTSPQNARLKWDALPELPSLRLHGAMVHLVNFVSGTLTAVNFQHLDEIQNMDSVLEMEVYPDFLEPGNEITKTIDIRSDAGWVQIINENPEAFKRDYDRIVQLMLHLFVTESTVASLSDEQDQ